jgi:NarL family two-component system response regulator YdfI
VTRIYLIAAPGSKRERLKEVLEASDVTVIGRADDLEVYDEELAREAEVVVMDASAIAMEDLLDSLQEALLLEEKKVILLLDQVAPDWVNRAVHAGVRGVLPVEVGAEQLAMALAGVAQGLVVLHPNQMQSVRSAGTNLDDPPEILEPLTARERDVLRMLSVGLSNKEIATRLKISDHTVKFHVAAILGKLGASTRTEAVSLALRRGLVLL